MTCKYPDCVGGQNGTHCAGPCQQGRLPCPTPEACECPEPDRFAPYAIGALVVAMLTVILLVLAVLSWR